MASGVHFRVGKVNVGGLDLGVALVDRHCGVDGNGLGPAEGGQEAGNEREGA